MINPHEVVLYTLLESSNCINLKQQSVIVATAALKKGKQAALHEEYNWLFAMNRCIYDGYVCRAE